MLNKLPNLRNLKLSKNYIENLESEKIEKILTLNFIDFSSNNIKFPSVERFKNTICRYF